MPISLPPDQEAGTSQPTPAFPHGEPVRSPRVRRAERWWDVLAVLFVLGGVVLFFFARHALNALSSGTYGAPDGVTYLSRTDLHVAQSRLALWMVGTGMTVGILAAVRHHLRRST